MIHTNSLEDDAEGPLYKAVAELEATRAGVTIVKERMATEGVHGSTSGTKNPQGTSSYKGNITREPGSGACKR